LAIAFGLACGGVMYDNGRCFVFTYTKKPNSFGENPAGEGYWSEIPHPDLRPSSSK
jgi:hypothetical protein